MQRNILFGPSPSLRMLDRLVRSMDRASSLGSDYSEHEGFEREGDRWVLRIALPGASAEDVQVEIQERTLTIRAQRRNEPPEGYRLLRRERTGDEQVVRAMTLPRSADPASGESQLRHGELTVSFAVESDPEPRRIDVTTGGGDHA